MEFKGSFLEHRYGSFFQVQDFVIRASTSDYVVDVQTSLSPRPLSDISLAARSNIASVLQPKGKGIGLNQTTLV